MIQTKVEYLDNHIKIGKYKIPIGDRNLIQDSYYEDSKGILEFAAYSIEKNLPLLMIGETGVGKTFLTRHLAKISGNRLYRVNLNGGTTTDELLGHTILRADNHGQVITQFKKNILPKAIEEQAWIIVDEISSSVPEVNFVFHSLLDDDRMIMLLDSENTEEIYWKDYPNFRFFAAMNPPKAAYAGVNELNSSLKSRFPLVLHIDYPDDAKILKDTLRISANYAYNMKKVAIRLRRMYANSDVFYPCGTRDIIQWGVHYKAFRNAWKGFKIGILGKYPEENKKEVISTYESIFGNINEPIKLTEEDENLTKQIKDLKQALKDEQEAKLSYSKEVDKIGNEKEELNKQYEDIKEKYDKLSSYLDDDIIEKLEEIAKETKKGDWS